MKTITVSLDSEKQGATISRCESYRYLLWRRWNPLCGIATWIMLNPSTADAVCDDPTIRRCISFSRRWGVGGIQVFNLFALRSSSPRDLLASSDPVGPDNLGVIETNIVNKSTYPLIAAWGAVHKHLQPQADVVLKLIKRVRPNIEIKCLGVTKNGHPRHPLYLRSDAELRDYVVKDRA